MSDQNASRQERQPQGEARGNPKTASEREYIVEATGLGGIGKSTGREEPFRKGDRIKASDLEPSADIDRLVRLNALRPAH